MKNSKLYIFIFFDFVFSACYESKFHRNDGFVYYDFIIDPSLGDHAACTHHVCDIIPQCGCPAGSKCTVLPGYGRACITAEGNGMDGAPCTAGECAPGYVCAKGICRRACNTDSDCIQTGACYRIVEEDNQKLCNTKCAPVINEGCPEGFRCDLRNTRPADYPPYYVFDCYIIRNPGGDYAPCFWGNIDDKEISPSQDCLPPYGCWGNDQTKTGNCNPECIHPSNGVPDPMCPVITPCCLEMITIDGISLGVCSHC